MRQPSEIEINGRKLDAILEEHRSWANDNGGNRADLGGADLGGADLGGADLGGANLGACFDGDDGDRQAVQYYLTGKQHMGDMTNGEIRALLKWLEPAKDANGKYYPNHMSVREANAALSVAFKDAGQAALI